MVANNVTIQVVFTCVAAASSSFYLDFLSKAKYK